MSCPEKACKQFNAEDRFRASWWVALAAFLSFLIAGSPVLYKLTGYIGNFTATKFIPGPLQVCPSWPGWFFHSVAAGLLGLGFGYLFMALRSNPKQCYCAE
jgi:hypothetical protein